MWMMVDGFQDSRWASRRKCCPTAMQSPSRLSEFLRPFPFPDGAAFRCRADAAARAGSSPVFGSRFGAKTEGIGLQSRLFCGRVCAATL
jgi:hypothetical protein